MKTATLLFCLLVPANVASAQAVAKPPAPPVTLWGVVMGQPVPATFAKCPKHPSGGDNTPCIRPRNYMFDGKNSVVLAHLPYPSGELRLAVLDQKVSHMNVNVYEEYCQQVYQALETKLGAAATHDTIPFQNGFGAQWTVEVWVWPQTDGTEVRYMTNVGGDNSCELNVTSAADVQRSRAAPVVQP
jgi:hypothetical protein